MFYLNMSKVCEYVMWNGWFFLVMFIFVFKLMEVIVDIYNVILMLIG